VRAAGRQATFRLQRRGTVPTLPPACPGRNRATPPGRMPHGTAGHRHQLCGAHAPRAGCACGCGCGECKAATTQGTTRSYQQDAEPLPSTAGLLPHCYPTRYPLDFRVLGEHAFDPACRDDLVRNVRKHRRLPYDSVQGVPPMLRVHRLPGSLIGLPEEFRPCFTAPGVHDVRAAGRGAGRGVASQPGAPVLRRCGVEPG
jgi:hypothetical protein